MHISKYQLPLPNNLTKCSKMTEEGHQLHGMNGNADGKIKDCNKSNNRQGGRLKFFKDGKFILELERAQEGERVSWVPVPRKTFWPPQGTVSSTPTYRQETCTSFSDDNSSIQSSPWQRDHTWKQTTPLRNISQEMTFFFWKPKGDRLFPKSKKCRTPYSAASDTLYNKPNFAKVKKEYNKRTILAIVQFLIDRNYRSSTSPRSETAVSPRKRFLREMEKDKFEHAIPVEDYNSGHGSYLKRSRSKPQQHIHCYNHQQSTPSLPQLPPSNISHCITNGEIRPSRNCSYSITSLLAEDRPCSPNCSPSHYSTVATDSRLHPTASSDDWWYSDSVNRLRSIELSHADKHHSNYPPPYLQRPHVAPASYFGGPYLYNMPTSPPGPPFLCVGRGYATPAVYQHRQEISRHEEWAVEARPYFDEEKPKEESPSDMPLNLSKHSG